MDVVTSANLLPRDAMQSAIIATTSRPSVCLSVCDAEVS